MFAHEVVGLNGIALNVDGDNLIAEPFLCHTIKAAPFMVPSQPQ